MAAPTISSITGHVATRAVKATGRSGPSGKESGFDGRITVGDRDKNGRFIKGNRCGKGRPRREVERAYLSILRDNVSASDAKAIVEQAVKDARKGDNVARKWIFDYLIGAPVQRIAPTDPSGEDEYRSIDLSRLTDDQLNTLAAIVASAGGDPAGAAKA
jgi:hypothetical protein